MTATTATTGDSADDFSPLAGTEVHHVRSTHVGDVFKIFIGHCGDTTEAPPAVLYITDANGLFAGAVDLIRLMQLSAHLPPILVVGIGYRMGPIADTVVVRARDLTPTFDPDFQRMSPAHTMMGGAPQFLAFIRDELQPWVGERFGVEAGTSMYFGHSLGGLFGTYVLLTEPRTFAGYGIGSPSLWWHDDMMFDVEAAYAQRHDDLPARVFVAVGEHETHEGRQREASRLPPDVAAIAGLRYIDMVADSERMVAQLRSRNHPGLVIDSVVLPGEFHITVPLLNLSRSLRFLFDAP